MKRIALLLILLLLQPVAANPFQTDFVLQVQPAKLDNGTTWVGKFRVSVRLVDETYRARLDELAQNDSEAARALFWRIINNTVYTSLRYNIIMRYSGAGMKVDFLLPEDGPIKLGTDWNATVELGVINFLVRRGNYYVSPVSGNLTLFLGNSTVPFTWRSFVLILPEGYVYHLDPEPAVVRDNVAVWFNGSYVPAIAVETPEYSLARYLANDRWLELRYTVSDGRLYFRAVFDGRAPGVVKAALLYAFKETLEPLSIDVVELDNSTVVTGVAIPPARRKDEPLWVTWEAYVRLPFSFERVTLEGGTYEWIAPNVLLIRARDYKEQLLAIPVVLVALLLLWRRR